MQKKRQLRRARPAAYEKGHARIESILDAAAKVLISGGYKKLTLRQIALRAGITVGNLTYYYRTKEALLKDLLDKIAFDYLDEMERVGGASGNSPTGRFVAIIEFLIEDLHNRRTTRLFPELWALANHNAHAAEMMDSMYAQERRVLGELIKAINPRLKQQETASYALFISCSIEGMTMFIGSGKKHENSLGTMKRIACRSFLQLVA